MDNPNGSKSSQDLFERFYHLRIAYRKHQLKDVERPLARYKIVKLQRNQALLSIPSLRMGFPVAFVNSTSPDDDRSPTCGVCGKAFGTSRRSIPCTVCGKRTCISGCCEKLTIRDELRENHTQQVDACMSCFKSLEWHRQKQELKVRNQKAQESAFCQLHRIVLESRDAIKEQMPKLRELLAIPPNEMTLDEWEHAREYETALSEYFTAIDIGSKKIASVQFSHQRGKTVLANFKAAILAFLQVHSPDFMILQKDLKAIPKPPRDRQPRAVVTVVPLAPTSASDAPVLSSIDPIVHPVAGGKMTVTGINFKQGIAATFIGPTVSRKGEVQFLSSSKIVVWGPPLPSAIYSLMVTNEDGQSAELSDIIIYSDEPFRNLSPSPSAAAPEPEWASEMKAKERELLAEEDRRLKQRQQAEEAERKRRAAAAAAAVPKAPELTPEAKQKLEEEKRREARKQWGKAP